jgi:hypothetical protein
VLDTVTGLNSLRIGTDGKAKRKETVRKTKTRCVNDVEMHLKEREDRVERTGL